MFQKRRSMLGRRHLMAQQKVNRPAQGQASEEGSSSNRGAIGSSWRGRLLEKNITYFPDKNSKKCLFSKSPGANYMTAYRMHGQNSNPHASNENLLDETGIMVIAQTPSSTPRNVPTTPATLQWRRAEMERTRYGPVSSEPTFTTNTAPKSDKPATISSSIPSTQTSYSLDFDNLKPPDSPGPSRLEMILLEEKLAQTSSSIDFNNLKPPVSPGPSRLDRLIMEEKLEQPLDPDLEKIKSLNLEEPNLRLQFSPPLSSTCIGSPDYGNKNKIIKEEIKKSALSSGSALGTIKEDCDVSVIEFELNERTICELDNTLLETTISNTLKPNNASCLGSILEEQNRTHVEEIEPSWENILFQLENMERAEIDRTKNQTNELKMLKEKIGTIEKQIEKQSLENINNIRSMKKTLESLKQTTPVQPSTGNKENDCTFRVPTCKKKQFADESKWFNSVKKENPSLLKTPNLNRKTNRSSILTPRTFTKVLHDQMNELYDN